MFWFRLWFIRFNINMNSWWKLLEVNHMNSSRSCRYSRATEKCKQGHLPYWVVTGSGWKVKCAACLLCVFGLAVQSGYSLSRVSPKLLCTPPFNPVNEDLTPEVLQKSRVAAMFALGTKQNLRSDVNTHVESCCSDWLNAWEEFWLTTHVTYGCHGHPNLKQRHLS